MKTKIRDCGTKTIFMFCAEELKKNNPGKNLKIYTPFPPGEYELNENGYEQALEQAFEYCDEKHEKSVQEEIFIGFYEGENFVDLGNPVINFWAN